MHLTNTFTRRFQTRTTSSRAVPSTVTDTTSAARDALIGEILEINQAAMSDFLREFDEPSLRGYLQHLRATQTPRGRDARWVRPDDSPAIEWRESRA